MLCKNCGHDNKQASSACTQCRMPLVPSPKKDLIAPKLSVTPSPLPKPASPPANLRPVQEEAHVFRNPARDSRTGDNKEVVSPVGKIVCPRCKYVLVIESDTCPMCYLPLQNKETSSLLLEKTLLPPTKDKYIKGETYIPTPPPPLPLNSESAIRQSNSSKPKTTTSPFNRVKTVKKTDTLSPVTATVDPYRQDPPQATAILKPISRENEPQIPGLVVAFEGKPIPLTRKNLEEGNNTITNKLQAEIEYRDGAWYITDKSGQHTTFVRAKTPIPIKKGDIILMGNRKFEFEG